MNKKWFALSTSLHSCKPTEIQYINEYILHKLHVLYEYIINIINIMK